MIETIPFFSARAVNSAADVLSPIKRVLESHWYILGQEVGAFEQEFAAYCGVANCVGVANGTDALELALRAVEVKPGSVVLLTANAGFYGSTAVRALGAIPLYIDVDPITLTMSAAHLRVALKTRPQAIIVTHLYGQLAEIETIVEIAAQSGVAVIEDCAQAHGAERQGRRAGSFGAVGCFSFYPTKNLGALGDGGAVLCQDPVVATRLKQLRQYGWGAKYHVELPGGKNSRLDEVQAAILRQKLPGLDAANDERRAIARHYNAAFSGVPMLCPGSLAKDYVAHLYVVRVGNRTAFREHLKAAGISTDVHYPIPDYAQAAYRCDQRQAGLAVTEQACAHVVSLPCYPGLGAEEIERVVQAVQDYFRQTGERIA